MRSSWADGVDRADVGVLVERVAHPQQLDPAPQPLEQVVGDALLHQQARARAADVALVEEDPVHDPLDRLVEGRVVEHQVGALAPELQGQARAGARPARGGSPCPRSVEPVKATLSTPGWAASAAPVAPAPVTTLTTPGRQLGLPDQLGQQQRRERRGLGRLQHHRVAAGERGRDLPRGHQQREVPGDDLAHHPERPRGHARDGVLQLVGPARVVEEVRRHQRQVDVARLADRLAAVDRLEHGQLARAVLHQAGQPEEVLRPRPARQVAPALLVGAPGGGDGVVDVRRAGLGHDGEVVAGGGLDRGELAAVARLALPRRRSSGRSAAGCVTMSRPSSEGTYSEKVAARSPVAAAWRGVVRHQSTGRSSVRP